MTRKRGRPPSMTVEHFEIWARVRQVLERRPRLSERQACRIVRRRYFPHRTEGAFWQTWRDLSKIEPRPGAEPGRHGYIEGHNWRSKNAARDRMLDFYRRIAFYFREQGEKGE